MGGSRAPTDTKDYRHTPYAERARMEKACALEHHAFLRGRKADDIVRDEVREELLEALAAERGVTRSRVHASVETWRLVWRLLRDRERPVDRDPFAGLDATHDPFAGGAR